MSRFLGKTAASISPYVPGEQPQDKSYIKLNTNECPYPPSPMVKLALADFDYCSLSRYPDPDSAAVHQSMAEYYGLPVSRVIAGGGSDELLGFAFMAFSSPGDKVYFADISYGFYRVYADLFGLEAVEIPLLEDFTIRCSDYYRLDGSIFIANPNAPTGIALNPREIEEILRRNPDRVVVVDEAYVDFAPGYTCVPLIDKYDNLLVVQTFSKSRSLAGMRLAFAFGQESLIDGLKRIKFSFNPYNIDRVSGAVCIAAIRDYAYFDDVVKRIITTRDRSTSALTGMGCQIPTSRSNFLFVSHPAITGKEIYEKLRENGVLVRHFSKPRIDRFVRLSIGTDEEMDICLAIMARLIKEAAHA